MVLSSEAVTIVGISLSFRTRGHRAARERTARDFYYALLFLKAPAPIFVAIAP
jgi:hypothetical protein